MNCRWSNVAIVATLMAVSGLAQAWDGRAGMRDRENRRAYAEVSKQVESSMLLLGSIEIDEQGRVIAHHLDQADLPKAMRELIDRRIRQWRFEPVTQTGKAVRARAPMQLRLVAKQDGEDYIVRIAGASFDVYDPADDTSVRAEGRLAPPRYPGDVASDGVMGTVYLVARVGRDGRVEDAVAEQVNLRAIGTERQMARYRDLLAKSAKTAALEQWRFVFPITGPDAAESSLSVRVPVDFVITGQPEERPGVWLSYVPGPRNDVPWRKSDAPVQAADTQLAGGVYPDRPNGPRLLSDLDG
jgi:hypothetical protein